MDNLSPETQAEVVEQLVQIDPSYGKTFSNIQERRIAQGKEPLHL